MSKYLIMHDVEDETLVHNPAAWADIAGAFDIAHVFKVGGVQEGAFVQYGPEHSIPQKFVCVMTPAECQEAGIEGSDLLAYSHPQDATYVFGPDNSVRGWHGAFAGPDTDYVCITTPGATELYSFLAAGLVLGHRWFTAQS